MKLPKEQEDVLVQLDNGKFTVAQYIEDQWLAGDGVYGSHEDGKDILSGKVVAWSVLPKNLENQLETTTSKPRLK